MSSPTLPLHQMLTLAIRQLAATLADLGPDSFPGDTSEQQYYQARRLDPSQPGSNTGWTTGFWTGQLWLAYRFSRQNHLLEAAQRQSASFVRRMDACHDLDHHDLGFLFELSCIADGSPAALDAARRAAAHLHARFLPAAGIIPSWGPPDDPVQRGRVIIDGAMNLPLLHWADKPEYRQAARRHLERTREHLLRPDGATFHTYHFDTVSGAALRPSTHQGAADDSCWARGQAWGLFGFARNHRHLPDMGLLDDAMRMADYFLAHLPPDRVALWDLSLPHNSGEPRDSSACAIAACGLLEIAEQLPQGPRRQVYHAAAVELVQALYRHCRGERPACGGLLRHGVYHRAARLGVDEANLWGDYYYLAALLRLWEQAAQGGV